MCAPPQYLHTLTISEVIWLAFYAVSPRRTRNPHPHPSNFNYPLKYIQTRSWPGKLIEMSTKGLPASTELNTQPELPSDTP